MTPPAGLPLSVVVPTYRRAGSLARVLAACAQQSLPPECFEVIVSVDGGHGGGNGNSVAAPIARAFDLRWVSGPHGGPSAARNRGAAAARGRVVLFLDDDIVPEPDCLAEHLAAHSGAPNVVGLGRVRLGPRRLSGWERYLTSRYDQHFAKLAAPGYAPTFWDCLSGSLSLGRDLLARSGGFDPAFDRHEDVELGYRLARLGARFVYRPRAVGVHDFVRGPDDGLRDAVGDGRTAGQLARRCPELAPRLLGERWRRYGAGARAALGWVLAAEGRHRRAAAAARRCLACTAGGAASRVAFGIGRPLYQAAYHLHFWLGVRAAAPGLLPAPLSPHSPFA